MTRRAILVLVASYLWAMGVDAARAPLRIVSSSVLRESLREPLIGALETASADLTVEWSAAGPRGSLRDLYEGRADVVLTIDRAQPNEIALADRIGVELHEYAVAVEPSASSGETIARTLWLYALGSFADVGELLDFLRLQGGRRALERAGLEPLVGPSHRSLEPESTRVFITRVGFGYRGYRLGATARAQLDGLVSQVKSEGRALWIVGHVEPTETRGEDDLSLLRAKEIAHYLEQRGIEPSRMTVEGVGASEPLTTHRTLEGRRESRRAEIWVLPQR